jgi:hypothetical protein
VIRRTRRDEDEIEVVGRQSGAFGRLGAGRCGERRGSLTRRGDPAFGDPRARADPVIRRVETLFELGVGQHNVGNRHTETDNG